jgi:hypothetical protein
MPMVNIVGQTSTRKTFYVAHCFVSNEQESSYLWTFQALQTQLVQAKIQAPGVIFSDDADALLNACGEIFKDSISLLCLWHIMKNIETRVRPIISKQMKDLPNLEGQQKTINEWRSVKAKFMQIILEPTEDGMEARKALFLESLSDPIYQSAIDYIEKQWFGDRAKRFMRCYLTGILHYDELTSSRVEGAHHQIKKELRSSTSDILATMQVVSRVVSYTNLQAFNSIQDEIYRHPVDLQVPLFRNILSQISRNAIRRVYNTWQEYLRSEKQKPLPSCTQYHMKSLGLPCNHVIKDLIDSGQSLLPSHFDQQHWLLLPNRVIQTNRWRIRRIGRVRINEPAQVKGVGRPKLLETVKRWRRWGGRNLTGRKFGAKQSRGTYVSMDKTIGIVVPLPSKRTNTSTRRIPSNWETKLRQGRGAGRGRKAKKLVMAEKELKRRARQMSKRRIGQGRISQA